MAKYILIFEDFSGGVLIELQNQGPGSDPASAAGALARRISSEIERGFIKCGQVRVEVLKKLANEG